jgi:hypothetical protein
MLRHREKKKSCYSLKMVYMPFPSLVLPVSGKILMLPSDYKTPSPLFPLPSEGEGWDEEHHMEGREGIGLRRHYRASIARIEVLALTRSNAR